MGGENERETKRDKRKLLTLVVPFDFGVGCNDSSEQSSLHLEGLEVGLGVGRSHFALLLFGRNVSRGQRA